MPINDDPSDLADWGDEEEAPQDTAESTGGVEADAVSLGGDDDDFEALKKYHQRTWDDTAQTQESQVSDVVSPTPNAESKYNLEPPQSAKVPLETNTKSPEKDPSSKPHGLPPKPQSPVNLRSVSTGASSMSAVAMAPRANGNQKHIESERDSSSSSLPPGWEEKTSRNGERYYYDTVADITTWDHPLKSKPSARPRTESQHHTTKPDREKTSAGDPPQRSRRSRSPRNRRKRSHSPQQPIQRRHSRSLERGSSYRPARDSPPRKEPVRLPRDARTARPRSRPPSIERPISPRPYPRLDHYSPPRSTKDERDGHRRERRSEMSQSSSTRHRSPPRTRSQEKSQHRPMEIDHYEPPSHGTVRRRRSWGSPDATDFKRRRVQEAAPRGIDRYVPDYGKNDRMDLDPPIHSNRDTKRPSAPEASATRHRNSSPPPYKRVNDLPAPLEKPPPPSHKERSQPLPSSQVKQTNTDTAVMIQRSRAPLPSQADAMRLGNRKRPIPEEADYGGKYPIPEQAPKGPRADRERAYSRVSPPPPPAGPDRASHSQRRDRSPDQRARGERIRHSTQEMTVERDGLSRIERGHHGDVSKRDYTERRTVAPSNTSQHPSQGHSRELPPANLKDSNDIHRGKGRGPKPPATSGSNNIPIPNLRGKFGQNGPLHTSTESTISQSEQPLDVAEQSNATSEFSPQNTKPGNNPELAMVNMEAPKARVSRFGPKQSIVPQPKLDYTSTHHDKSALQYTDDTAGLGGDSAARHSYPPSSHGEEVSKDASLSLSEQATSEYRDRSVPDSGENHPVYESVPNHQDEAPETAGVFSPLAPRMQSRREDGLRIDRSRGLPADHAQQTEVSYDQQDPYAQPSNLLTDSVNVQEAGPSGELTEGVVSQDSGQMVPSGLEGHIQTQQQSPQIEQAKPEVMQRKGSLLERLGPGPPPGQSGILDDPPPDQEAAPRGEPTERGRPRRGRRSGRGSRR